ncbi:hypothetical protein CDG77_22325 [Nostoc sp. 'Peltigera membranacea cyanobiont' 213]|uniref:hypothetical protein n=1 Tax=Nostoc sp. 'Peltigera membranacea cyanobiont' 213 TaxID=2014530 RepID=UPI000B9546CF|nr:hypothetical protein [Nostoc sp. 'Peltigera membranacea cyanobiont' 213]OYD88704.1 hypothetical protein CDG77_22325 [Nostoc sp. 'Peltigera membranacea cyanobiont' 213]
MKLRVNEKLGDRVQGVGQKNLAYSLKKKNYSWLLACGFWVFGSNILAYPAFSTNPTPNPSALAERENVNDGAKSLCSEQNLETLTIQLLEDLPSYTNRASQRARRLSRSSDIYSYVLVAGKPEFSPLPLNLEEYGADASKNSASGIEQVFFTTLGRQYIGRKALELQEFHWLLLTKTTTGWRLVMMFSQTSSNSTQQPLSPPRDSSNGTVAQGVKTWLRDCQAGSVQRMRAVNGGRYPGQN